ncbi:hypothetical protein ACA910_022544 [Epithemia clementina (nom. ined.)]
MLGLGVVQPIPPDTPSYLEGNEEYHHFIQQIRTFIDRMMVCGLDKYIALPMIAVMGDTSSGKSALLSNTAEIELPSAHTLTTRCPIMIKMKTSDTWSAKISVKLRQGTANGGENATDFNDINLDKNGWSRIRESIALAQDFILRTTRKQVARDVVDVEIHAPYCVDLTLIDLPGIVRSTGKGESASLSPEIQALINDYLNNDRCVILAVHPANVDFHNSQIMQDAKKVDPQTRRTLPVITKPDLIDNGAEGGVMDLLLGKKMDGFDRGFHMIKSRGQSDLDRGLSIRQGLEDEECFFRQTDPWNRVADRSLFGTSELRRKLGALQMEIIKDSFPGIVEEVKQQHTEAKGILNSMGSLPDSASARRGFFHLKIEEFFQRLKEQIIDGKVPSSSNALSVPAQFFDMAETFKSSITSTRLAAIDRPVVDDGAEAVIGCTLIKGKVLKILNGKFFLDSYTVKGYCPVERDGKFKPTATVFQGKHVDMKQSNGVDVKLQPIDASCINRDPEWLHLMIKQRMPLKLQMFPNDTIFIDIVATLIDREWKEPSTKLLKDSEELLKNACKTAAGQAGLHSYPLFKAFLYELTHTVVGELADTTRSSIDQLFNVNQSPYSQNKDLVNEVVHHRTEDLECALETALNLKSLPQNSSIPVSTIANAIKAVFEPRKNKSVMDIIAGDLQNALAAYGKIAVTRIADEVPMLCKNMFENLEKEMRKRAFAVSDMELEGLLKMPAHVQRQIREAKEKIEMLDQAVSMMKELKLGTGENPAM